MQNLNITHNDVASGADPFVRLPASAAVRLGMAFDVCYSPGTAYPAVREAWDPEHRELGHCALTSLYVHEFYGGIIQTASLADHGLGIEGLDTYEHFWNIVQVLGKGVCEHDFTRRQIPGERPPFIGRKVHNARNEILFSTGAKVADTERRYRRFKNRVFDVLMAELKAKERGKITPFAERYDRCVQRLLEMDTVYPVSVGDDL